jgi:hypothetical protein
MAIKVLELLQKHQYRILKMIVIISIEGKELGTIIYSRKLTEKYNFKKKSEIENHPNSSSSIEIFPNDYIDNYIFNSIKKLYPKSSIINETQYFKTDLQKVEVLKNRKVFSSKIIFQPFIAHIDYNTLRRENITSYEYVLKIYSKKDNVSELIDSFFVNYDFEKDLYNDLGEIEFK